MKIAATFALLLGCVSLTAAQTTFPIRASEDGRYLVDASAKPFLYHADTGWTITKKLLPSDVVTYLDNRKTNGFTAIHIHAFSKEVGPVTNQLGYAPFEPLDDILKPDRSYWFNVEMIIHAAADRGLLVAMSAIWIRWGGKDKEGWRSQLTDENAVEYATFLGNKFKTFNNLIWILGGDANPGEKTKAISLMGATLRKMAPHQLIAVHNAPENSSAAFFADEEWLGINMAYTYGETHRHVLGEWKRTGKVRPIILGESGYEEESNDKRGGDPFRMRRQAYGALLSGALGGHAFGQKHVWRFDGEWKGALNSPANRHMGHVKKLFSSCPWHRLRPDYENKFVVGERGAFGGIDYVAAAATEDGTWAIVYLPAARPVTVNRTRIAGQSIARWFDPTDGSYRDASGTAEFKPPGKNAAGDTDFGLIFQPPQTL